MINPNDEIQHIQISNEMEKVQELKHTIIESLLYVTAVTWNLTKEHPCLNKNEWKCGNKPIELPSVKCLKGALLIPRFVYGESC